MNDQTRAHSFVEPEQLRDSIEKGENIVIIDVRSPEEFSAGHVEGAINVPADQLNTQVAAIAKDAAIVTVCNFGGQRSCNAAEQLRAMGYENAAPLRGGTKGWRETAGPTTERQP